VVLFNKQKTRTSLQKLDIGNIQLHYKETNTLCWNQMLVQQNLIPGNLFSCKQNQR